MTSGRRPSGLRRRGHRETRSGGFGVIGRKLEAITVDPQTLISSRRRVLTSLTFDVDVEV